MSTGGGDSRGGSRWAWPCSQVVQGGFLVKPAKGLGVLGNLWDGGAGRDFRAWPRFHVPYENTSCQSHARSRSSSTNELHTISFPLHGGRTEVCYLFSELMNYP